LFKESHTIPSGSSHESSRAFIHLKKYALDMRRYMSQSEHHDSFMYLIAETWRYTLSEHMAERYAGYFLSILLDFKN